MASAESIGFEARHTCYADRGTICCLPSVTPEIPPPVCKQQYQLPRLDRTPKSAFGRSFLIA